jgi:Na+-transporting methylmalonyl-CoA/oxaloacetate decarboxylase gamma subunit
MKNRSIGMILLAIYLILVGLTKLVPSLNFSGMGIVMAILAILAGVLILIGK